MYKTISQMEGAIVVNTIVMEANSSLNENSGDHTLIYFIFKM